MWAGFLRQMQPFAAVFMEYEGRQPTTPPAPFATMEAFLEDQVFGTTRSVAEHFRRQLGFTLGPIGGIKVWMPPAIPPVDYQTMVNGQTVLRDGEQLRAMAKRAVFDLLSIGQPFSNFDGNLNNVVQSPYSSTPAPSEMLLLAFDNLKSEWRTDRGDEPRRRGPGERADLDGRGFRSCGMGRPARPQRTSCSTSSGPWTCTVLTSGATTSALS